MAILATSLAQEDSRAVVKRGIFGEHIAHHDQSRHQGHEIKQEDHVKATIITKEVKYPLPQPYPVTMEKKVPYTVKIPVQVEVKKPYPVEVPKPYPVYVEKKVPFIVEKEVPYPVKVEVNPLAYTDVPETAGLARSINP